MKTTPTHATTAGGCFLGPFLEVAHGHSHAQVTPVSSGHKLLCYLVYSIWIPHVCDEDNRLNYFRRCGTEFVAASWLVVGTGELFAVVEWIPVAM